MSLPKPLIYALLAVVALGFGFQHFVLAPKAQDKAAIDTKITEQQGRLEAAKALLANNTEAKARFRSDYSTVVRLGKAVPPDDDTASLVYQLNQAAHASGVDFDAIELDGTGSAPTDGTTSAATALPPGATVGPAGFPVMPFKFTFTGRYFELARFVDRVRGFVRSQGDGLRVGGRLVTLDSISLAPDDNAGGFPHITAEIGATTFLLPEDEGLTAGADGAGLAEAAGSGATGAATASTAASVTPTTTTR